MPLGIYDIGTERTIFDNGLELTRITKKFEAYRLSGGVNGKDSRLYALSYEDASRKANEYHSNNNDSGGDSLRVSLYLNNAMFGDLHIFVIDFDETDENSDFFMAAYALANKVTRSKSGGYHMFYGVNKEAAHPLFDSINLLASKSAASWVNCKRAWTNDGSNRVDMFCDATQLIYEFEKWDNSIGLTDQTQPLYELIRDNFTLTRPNEYDDFSDASGGDVELEGMTKSALLERMDDTQKKIFTLLEQISSDCDGKQWKHIGFNIRYVFPSDFMDDLGGSVWLWWSKRGGDKFNAAQCARTWAWISRQNNVALNIPEWKTIIEDAALFGT